MQTWYGIELAAAERHTQAMQAGKLAQRLQAVRVEQQTRDMSTWSAEGSGTETSQIGRGSTYHWHKLTVFLGIGQAGGRS